MKIECALNNSACHSVLKKWSKKSNFPICSSGTYAQIRYFEYERYHKKWENLTFLTIFSTPFCVDLREAPFI